jgi:hypothetical protein
MRPATTGESLLTGESLVSRNSTLVKLLAVDWPDGRSGLERTGGQLVEELQKLITAMTIGGSVARTEALPRPFAKKILDDLGE